MPLEPLSAMNPALSFEDAMEHAQIKTPTATERIETMDWDATHANLAAKHEDSTQRAALARMALEQIRQGVNELATLGHYFQLTEADAPKGQDFPKMLYHTTGGQMVANSQGEQDLLAKDGWDEHPSLKAAADAAKTTSKSSAKSSS